MTIYSLSISLQIPSQTRQIAASKRAFAAIREDASVVSWGPAEYGGDSRMVRQLLVDVMLGPSLSLGDGSKTAYGNQAVAPDFLKEAIISVIVDDEISIHHHIHQHFA